MFNDVVNYRNEHGYTISDPFLQLPNRRKYPHYRQEIDNPISLKIIRKKVLTQKYKVRSSLTNPSINFQCYVLVEAQQKNCFKKRDFIFSAFEVETLFVSFYSIFKIYLCVLYLAYFSSPKNESSWL